MEVIPYPDVDSTMVAVCAPEVVVNGKPDEKEFYIKILQFLQCTSFTGKKLVKITSENKFCDYVSNKLFR